VERERGGLVLAVAASTGIAAESAAAAAATTPAASSAPFAGVFIAAIATAVAAAVAAATTTFSSWFPGRAPGGSLVVARSGSGSAGSAVPAGVGTLSATAAAAGWPVWLAVNFYQNFGVENLRTNNQIINIKTILIFFLRNLIMSANDKW
jgi:hypothetical protein